MPKYDAYIIYHDGRYLVRPAFAIVKDRTKFEICNMTDFADAEVTLPVKKVRQGTLNKQSTDLAGPNGKALKFDLATTDDCFTYQVTVDGYAAEGESDPVIIIDP